MTRALLCIDFINDIMSDGGKLASKGYKSFADAHDTLKIVSELQVRCRDESIPVIHIRIGFDRRYLNHPKSSPLFGTAAKFRALELGTPATDFVSGIGPLDDELVIHKPRVSAFYGTELESALRALRVNEILICGVATDLAVQSTVRDAHDRDYSAVVISDGCAAASDYDHEISLVTLAKVATVETSDLVLARINTSAPTS